MSNKSIQCYNCETNNSVNDTYCRVCGELLEFNEEVEVIRTSFLKSETKSILVLSLIVPVLGLIWVHHPVYILHMFAFWFIFGPAVEKPSINKFFLHVLIRSIIVFGIGYGQYVISSTQRLAVGIKWSIDLYFVGYMLYPFIFNMLLGLVFIAVPYILKKKGFI